MCPVGTYYVGNSCELCAIGDYNDMEGQTECTGCPDDGLTAATGSTSADDCNSCPTGYTFVDQSCYRAASATKSKLTMAKAVTACASDGGWLATFEDDGQYWEFRETAIEEGWFVNGDLFWVGATKSGLNYVYQYGSNTGDAVDSDLWAVAEPNRKQSCVQGGYKSKFKLGTVSCGLRKIAICQTYNSLGY